MPLCIYIVKAQSVVNSLLEDDPKDEIMRLPSAIVYGEDCVNCNKLDVPDVPKFAISPRLDREVEINRMFDNTDGMTNCWIAIRDGQLGVIVYARISCQEDEVKHRGYKMVQMTQLLEREQVLRGTDVYVCRPNDFTLEFRAFVHRHDVGNIDLDWISTTLSRYIQRVID